MPGNRLLSKLMLESDPISRFNAVTVPDPVRKSLPENERKSELAVMAAFIWTVPSAFRFTTEPPEIGLASVKLEPEPRA